MQTIVITGASSGIGRAIALAFAERGDRVVLASRRAPVLLELARLCGPGSLPVPTDVTDPKSVQGLLDQAIAHFGSVDMWVNCAVVAAVGAYDETPWEAHEQSVRVGLLGVMNSAHVVLQHFRQQGRGIVVNLNSIGAWVPAPYVAAYSACKFGLRGFSEALRAELNGHPNIHICDVYPGFVDTPAFQHTANYVGREIKPTPPLTHPAEVARKVVALLENPQPSTFVGSTARLGKLVHALAPALVGWGMARFFETYFTIGPEAPKGPGNLYQGRGQTDSVTGGWRERARAKLLRGVGLAALGVTCLGILSQTPKRSAVRPS